MYKVTHTVVFMDGVALPYVHQLRAYLKGLHGNSLCYLRVVQVGDIRLLVSGCVWLDFSLKNEEALKCKPSAAMQLECNGHVLRSRQRESRSVVCHVTDSLLYPSVSCLRGRGRR